MSRRITQLSVYVHETLSGLLTNNPGQLWNFTYQSDTAREDVSLNMPRAEPTYTSLAILPPFEQCLPEMDIGLFPGALWKIVQPTELGLLWVTGRRRLGRLRFAEPGETPHGALGLRISREELSAIENGEAFFLDAVAKATEIPGVAGVQPKLLASVHGLEHPVMETDTHILKASRAEFPWLTVIESLCLRAAQAANIETPDFQLSGDGRLLAVRRFDLDVDGRPLGFDELCPLMGLLSAEKYTGSYEAMLKSARDFLPSVSVQGEMLTLFKQLAFSHVIENGDAHLKNFGLVYDQPESARVAPAYDLVTTTCYLPSDTPALTLGGKKAWSGALERLCVYMRDRFDIPPRLLLASLTEMAGGIVSMRQEVHEATERYPQAATYINRMHDAWGRGLAHIRDAINVFR